MQKESPIHRDVLLPDGAVEVFLPYRDRDGNYILAKPGAGNDRNRAANQIKTKSLEEVVARLKQKCNIRMRSDRARHGLYSPKSDEFVIDDAK